MKVLQVCNKLPFPPVDGGAIAMNNVTQGLLEKGVQLKVFAISTPKSFDVLSIPEEYKRKTSFETVFIDTTVRPFDALKNLFSSSSYNLERFNDKRAIEKLVSILKKEKFDIIQLESLFVAPFIPVIREHSLAKIVLRAHNVEHKIWQRLAASASFPKKQYLSLMASRLKREEIRALQEVDGVATITHLDEAELKRLGVKVRSATIPFGLPVKTMKATVSAGNKVFHLGSMDWLPNLEGVSWFLDRVFPLLEKKGVKFDLHLAGKKMPEDILKRNGGNCRVEGEVNDGPGFIADKNIMIVPLLSGGGMRVKIVEGMALGKAIVSTSVGAEGIPYENGKNILIADTPADFARAIENCVSDPGLCRSLGENARKLAEDFYDNSLITEKLLNFYKDLQG